MNERTPREDPSLTEGVLGDRGPRIGFDGKGLLNPVMLFNFVHRQAMVGFSNQSGFEKVPEIVGNVRLQ